MIRRWSLALLCLVAVPTAATAQTLEDYDYENLSFRGIGLEYGRIWPTKVEPTAAYTVKADLGFLGPGVRITPSLSYWSSAMDDDELSRLADQLSRLGAPLTAEDLGRIEWRDVSLNVDGQYVIQASARVQPYLGLGAGVHVFDGRGAAVEETFIEDLLDSITAGVNAVAGVEVAPTERLRLGIEGRYTLLDDIRYPEARIGASFALPAGAAAGGAR
ncbi:MAG TPA: outer membrane beta-barrel protein [Longimicrobiales bacterium]